MKSSELIPNDRNCTEQNCHCTGGRGRWCSCFPNSPSLIFCYHYHTFALACSIWNMSCTTIIECRVHVLYICRYEDAKTGNIELIPINTKCGRITCMPGTTSPPTTPLLPTRPVREAGCGEPTAKPAVAGLYEFSTSLSFLQRVSIAWQSAVLAMIDSVRLTV